MPLEKVEICLPPAGVLDMSSIRIIVTSDVDYFINGTIKFLKPVKAPWKIHCTAEQFYRDQWVPGFGQKMADYCAEKRNPANVFSQLMEGKKDCPLDAGVSLEC